MLLQTLVLAQHRKCIVAAAAFAPAVAGPFITQSRQLSLHQPSYQMTDTPDNILGYVQGMYCPSNAAGSQTAKAGAYQQTANKLQKHSTSLLRAPHSRTNTANNHTATET